jgi:hypothetical protein
MSKTINEEIRLNKLERIHFAERKIEEYKELYTKITENLALKLVKNSTSFLLRVVLSLAILLFVVISIMYFFPNWLIEIMESEGDSFTYLERQEFILEAKYIRYIFLGIAFSIWMVSKLIKANNKKRNKIFQLSDLLLDMTEYMESSLADEKKKYEFFVDNVVEMDRKETENSEVKDEIPESKETEK